MASRFKHVTVRPKDGGQLFTAISAETAGAANYVVKQDFRRELDQEIRREGYDYFVPDENGDGTSNSFSDTLAEIGTHPFPGGSGVSGNIELVHMIRRTNGQTAIIVAQKTATDYKFYKYTGRDDMRYVLGRDDDNDGTIESSEPYIQTSDSYFSTAPVSWKLIGSGYSHKGNRWEAVNINGYTIFNNGYDLPFAYRIEWEEVKPLNNLREAGIVNVGSITEYNGILLLSDVTELEEVEYWFSNPDKIVGSSWNPYGIVTNVNTNRYHNRLIWSQINEPEKFGAAIKGSITANQLGVTLKYKDYGEGFSVGQQVTITGAGTAGGNLTATITEISKDDIQVIANGTASSGASSINVDATTSAIAKDTVLTFATGVTFKLSADAALGTTSLSGTLAGGNIANDQVGRDNYEQFTFTLDTIAATTVTNADISPTTELDSIIGYEDLEDDGSGIVNMMPLQSQIVIYKDTSIFVGEYTGDTTSPFKFRLIKIPLSRGLYYKNSLISLKGSAHAFIGRDNFYVFDLSMRSPKEMVPGQVVRDLFYDQVEISQSKDVFAANNVMTNELWFVFPSAATHKALCFDYIQNTMSTTTHEIKSAASVKKPFTNQNMFIMGMGNGTLVHYGKSDIKEGRWRGSGNATISDMYYRRNANAASVTKNGYESVLKSGLINFGDSYNEKQMKGYVLQLASQQAVGPTINLRIFGYENPYSPATTLTGSSAYQITDVQSSNLVPTHFKSHLFQDELTIPTTQIANVRIATRTFDVKKVGSQSEVRQDPPL